MAGYAYDKTMSGMRRMGAKLTSQEEEIIDVSFESFSEKQLEKGTVVQYIDSDKLKEAFTQIDASSAVADIQLLIDDIDENGDGRIDKTEWRAIMSRKFLGEEDDSSFMHVFMMLDDNKDGYIPLVELRKMLMQEGQAPLSEQEVDELLMFADLDSDGLVDYRSFLRWLSAPEQYAKAQKKQTSDAYEQGLRALMEDFKQTTAAGKAVEKQHLKTFKNKIELAKALDERPEEAIEEAEKMWARLDKNPMAAQDPSERPVASSAAASNSAAARQPQAQAEEDQQLEEKINMLMNITSRDYEDCKEALKKRKGNVEQAANDLYTDDAP